MVAARVLPKKRVYPSFRPSVHTVFFGMESFVFSKFWHGVRNPYEIVRDRAGFIGKYFFAPKRGKWAKNGPLKSLVITFFQFGQ